MGRIWEYIGIKKKGEMKSIYEIYGQQNKWKEDQNKHGTAQLNFLTKEGISWNKDKEMARDWKCGKVL